MTDAAPRPGPDLEPGWSEVLASEFNQPYMDALRAFLVTERRHDQVFPPGRDIFNAFKHTPFRSWGVRTEHPQQGP